MTNVIAFWYYSTKRRLINFTFKRDDSLTSTAPRFLECIKISIKVVKNTNYNTSNSSFKLS